MIPIKGLWELEWRRKLKTVPVVLSDDSTVSGAICFQQCFP